jgi:hypothetical protein
MLKFIASRTLTLFLFLLTVGYLMQFRLLGIIPFPEGMVYLAVALILQCLVALFYRVLLLKGKIREQDIPGRLKGHDMKGTLEDTSSYLEKMGFTKTSVQDNGDKDTHFFSKGLKVSCIIEAALYVTLIFIFTTGFLNYAFGINGFVEFGATGGWMDIDGADLDKGVLARIMPTSIQLRLSEKTPAGHDKSASVVFEASKGEDEENIDRYWLQPGDYVRFGMLRIQFMGDYYLAFPTVFKKRHDYRAVSSKLKEKDAGSGIYSGDLGLRQSGRRGTVEYEPTEKKFRVRVYRDEEIEFDTAFIHPGEGRDGDFTVRVPSIGHIAVLHVSRYSYRIQVLTGMALLIVLLLIRMVLKPQQIWIRREKGKTMIFTKRRKVRKTLVQP